MKTSVDSCLKEIGDWYVKNRRSMTEAELGPILKKHCESEAEVRKFVAFLGTEPGQTRFKIHLKERKESAGESSKPSPSITEIIHETIKEFGKSPKEINLGWCGQFAGKVIAKLEAMGENATFQDRPLIPRYAGHIWIKYKGKHYDAEHPEGVEDYRSLLETEPWQSSQKPSYLKETGAEIEEVLESGYVTELKTGGWKKQLNRMGDGSYQVEVYWDPWYLEAPRPEYWSKSFKTEQESKTVYDQLISKAAVDRLLTKEASYLTEALPETECQLISPQYYDILTWFNIPVPDYSFAIEPEVRERKIDEVLQKLKDGVSRIHESAVFREFLTTMAKFWEYSFGNQILIMLQRPGATRVAGFVTWKELGRHVKFGEKGIAILAPCLPPKALQCPICDKPFTEQGLRTHLSEFHQRVDVSELIKLAKGEAVGVPTPTYFKVVNVFDVSQTEGKPLPEIAVPVLSGAFSKELYDKLMALASKHSLTVSFEPRPELDPAIKGMLLGKTIWVKGDEPEAQRLKTLAHEHAHYFTEAVYFIPRADAEVIAESVAFVVGAHFGFDSGTRSFPYVALWAKEKKVLEQNLASIRKISGRMIEEVG